MEHNLVDARGRSCPEPVILTKKAIKANPQELEILVNTEVARDNVVKMLENKGYTVNMSEEGQDYRLTAFKEK